MDTSATTASNHCSIHGVDTIAFVVSVGPAAMFTMQSRNYRCRTTAAAAVATSTKLPLQSDRGKRGASRRVLGRWWNLHAAFTVTANLQTKIPDFTGFYSSRV